MFSLAAISSTVSLPSEMIPTPLAMALAVIGWSPVTMITYNEYHRHIYIQILLSTSTLLSKINMNHKMSKNIPVEILYRSCGYFHSQIHIYESFNNNEHFFTLIPADRHFPTASGTAARGGSIIDISPTNLSPVSGKFSSSASNGYPGGNWSSGNM